MLGRPEAGTIGRTLVINLPGSPSAALESLRAVEPALEHGLALLRSEPGTEAGHTPTAARPG
jgi:molybdopterin biosynthesis enzyme MoaB